MKSLIKFINEAKTSFDSENVKAYFDAIHDGLKTAIKDSIDNTNDLIKEIVTAIGTDNAPIVLKKSQIYGSLIEGFLYKELNNNVDNFSYKQGKEDTSDKDFICTKASLKGSPNDYSIQVITTKNKEITSNISKIDNSFYILIFYKLKGNNISLDKAYFGYNASDNMNLSSIKSKLNEMVYEI